MDHPELGRKFRTLSDLEDEDLAALARVLATQVLATHDVLVEEGTPTDTAWLIWDGTVSAHVRIAGKRVPLGRVEPGHVVGAVSFLDRGAMPMTIEAATPVVAYGLSRSSFDGLLETSPRAAAAIHLAMCRSLARKVRDADQRLERLKPASGEPADEQGGLLNVLKGLFGLD